MICFFLKKIASFSWIFEFLGGLFERIKVPRRSWNPSRSSSHIFPSRTDFWLNASGMPCAFSGWTPRKKRTGMAAIFGAGWPLEFSSRKLASPCLLGLFAFCAFLFRSAIRSASTWQILEGPSTLRKGRFTISSRTQGLGLVPCLVKFHDVPGVFLVKPVTFLPFPQFLDVQSICAAPRRMNWSSISRKFRPVRWWQHRAQFHVSVPGKTRLRLTGTVLRR